jgi:hypothetical protein
MSLQSWVKLPTGWITDDKGLRGLRWTADQGANNLAALMMLVVIAHHADPELGLARLTYNQLGDFAGLSRAKVSGGLTVLEERRLVERRATGRSSFQLISYDPSKRWGKLPARRLYTNGRIGFFASMTLRKSAELHALKLYLLFVAMRDNSINLAKISYDRIEDYTDINRYHIKPALSVLAANGVVHVENVPASGDYGVANAYRIAFIDDRRHFGTTLRNQTNIADLFE